MRRAFDSALTEGPSGDATAGLARAPYLSLDFSAAVDGWCLAYTLHRAIGDHVDCVRVARTLSCIYPMILGEFAVAKGCLARADVADPHHQQPRARRVASTVGMFEGDRTRNEQYFIDALAIARQMSDVELELVTVNYLGASLVHTH